MKIKHFIIPVLVVVFTLCLIPKSTQAGQEKEQEEQESEIIIIPDQVKSVMEEGMTTREPRSDIPFSIIWHVYLPAQQNMHSVFYFKVKNADLGFAPEAPQQKTPEEKKEEKEEVPPPEVETTPAKLKANGHVFLQFNRMENEMPQEMIKEVYIPLNLEADSTSFQPQEEGIYSTGYPLPPGDYLLSMAITSLNLERIGTQYYEFSLPDSLSFTESLGTTPVFFVNNIERMASPETQAEIHKEFFTYSVLQITPKLENDFSAGENLDIFFFIFGAQPNQEGKFSIDISFEVFEGEEKVIRYETAHYDAPLISQPLPMKKTVIIKTEKEGKTTERREQRDLEQGEYILKLVIEDKVSGKSLEKSVDFEVVEKS
ncbi:MAG: hypothetical protein ACLFVG_06445 [Candidatus Aminicenantes bacterium]